MNSTPVRNRRILVIDDNRAIHDDFRKILCPASATAAALDITAAALFGRPINAVEQTRFEITSAYQGQEGVLKMKTERDAGHPYAMAFVDVRMPPGLDGVETTLKLWELDPNLQVVLCTAYADYSWNEIIATLGHRDGLLILKKPFDSVEAVQLAYSLTEKWRLHQQSRMKMEELEGRVTARTKELQQTNDALQTEVSERTRAQSFLHSVVENLPIAVFIKEAKELRFVLWNKAGEKLTGIPNARMIGKNDYDFFPSEDADLYVARDRAALATRSVQEIAEEVIQTPDRGPRITHVWKVPIFDALDQPTFLLGISEDITERKLMENALRESNEKFRQLADNITDAFWIRSQDMQVVHYISPAFEQIFGRPMASLYAHPHEWTDFILPEDRERVTGSFAALTGETSSLDIEYRITRPDGEIRWVRVRGFHVRDAADKVIRHAGIVTDITERKLAADQLRESERRFSDMLRNLELLSVMLDRQARITYCNDYLLRLTGWAREEVIGQEWFKLFIPPEHISQIQRVHSALLLDQSVVWHHENEILTRAGARRLIRWNNSVLRSTTGNVIGTASIGEDITQRKQLEARLFQSQKLETVGKLAGGVAHEFNSIMTVIIGHSEFLLNDLSPASALGQNVIEIRKAAERAATLTRQLLAYGRKQFLQPEVLDLNAVLTGLESPLRNLLGRDVDIRLALAPRLKAVKADASQIEQVIMNMAINARDAMPNGGKLMLETANMTFDKESVGGDAELKPGDYVLLAITDTGMGMSADVKGRLFEPFFSTKATGQGTGLGLSTCYGIIKQSGGHISVYSELARGATFKIFLPQVATPASPILPRLDSLDLPGGTETILLVEDDPALRALAATLLSRLGYTVLAAANGIDALNLKQQRDTGHIDLLFTDVVMPHMSGQELADRVRALFPHTRILFTSAYTENSIIHQGVLTKGMALLQKPFTPSALAHKLREVLDAPGEIRSEPTQKTFGFSTLPNGSNTP